MRKQLRNEFTQQLRAISTQTVTRGQIIAERLKITPADLESLEVLLREGKATAGRLAKHTGLTTGAITGVIDRLVHSGFAVRKSDPKDRRKVLVVPKIKKIAEEIVPLYDSISGSMDKLLETYSEPEQNVIIDFLKKASSLGQKDMEKIQNR